MTKNYPATRIIARFWRCKKRYPKAVEPALTTEVFATGVGPKNI